MEEPQKRQIAIKVRISDILDSTYVRGEGWQPNYVLTKERGQVSRLNIIATVVSLEQDLPNSTIIIDDGTGTISLRPFEELPSIKKIGLGDIVNIIGKPRASETEKYIVPEIVRKITDEDWVRVRQKELETAEDLPIPAGSAKLEEPVIEEIGVAEPTQKQENSFQKVYRLIKELDKGDGAATEDVIRAAGLHNTEEIIGELLKEGEIFEIRSGSLKVLE